MPGVVGASVGYTGRSAVDPHSSSSSSSPPAATYDSVCDGDGNTEAVRVEFDPAVLGYEELIRRFVESPRVPNIYGPQDPQYMVAIWVASEEQREAAMRACADAGKNVPVLDATPWFDAEDRHQNFFGS